MKKYTSYYFVGVQLLILVLSLLTDWYIPLCYLSILSIFLMTLQKLGRGIVLRETVALHSSFICLVMPTLGYMIYTRTNYLGIWIKYMPVPESVYFSFALPGITAFVIGLCWPLADESKTDFGDALKKKIAQCRDILSSPFMKKTSMTILISGVMVSLVSEYLPKELKFVFDLFYFSAFAGFLYVYFSPSFKYKWAILAFFALFIFYNALRTGMFTVVAYMGITLFSFFFLGSRASLLKKVSFFAIGGFCLLLIQTVKPEYRKSTWRDQYAGSKSELFFNILSKQASQGSLFSPVAYYPIYSRTNQGYNVGLVMRRVPEMQPYDNGRLLSLSFASAFVPRVLWPDKPEAGGKFNMKYFAGMTISGYSTNVGPLGEAYGSFGPQGGIVFMIILGIFVRWAYLLVFTISKRTPLMIFWLPVLFYQTTYSAETDCLQIFNSLIKSGFFIWALYKILPRLFGIRRVDMKNSRRKVTQIETQAAP